MSIKPTTVHDRDPRGELFAPFWPGSHGLVARAFNINTAQNPVFVVTYFTRVTWNWAS
jgi:hypothetical protein